MNISAFAKSVLVISAWLIVQTAIAAPELISFNSGWEFRMDGEIDWKAVAVVLAILFVVATIFYCGCRLIEYLNGKVHNRNRVHLRGSMR